MTEPAAANLVAHPIGPDDFSVLDDGNPVGRIRLARERGGGAWLWNVTIPLPMPPSCSGTAADREAAKRAFRDAWTGFKAEIGPVRYAEALASAADARARLR